MLGVVRRECIRYVGFLISEGVPELSESLLLDEELTEIRHRQECALTKLS